MPGLRAEIQFSVLKSEGLRLDRLLFLCGMTPSTREAKKLVERGLVAQNNKRANNASIVTQRSDLITIANNTAESQYKVLFEDKFLIAVDKPVGLEVVSSRGQDLCSFLKEAVGDVWPVHRLDRETSGIVLFARTKKAQELLEDLFREHEIEKTYLAVVRGRLNEHSKRDGVWKTQLKQISKAPARYAPVVTGGKMAITEFSVKKEGAGLLLLELRPRTGRTHQLRVQCRQHQWPILGDNVYGDSAYRSGSSSPGRMLLHAWKVRLVHPLTKKPLALEAPVPTEFQISL